MPWTNSPLLADPGEQVLDLGTAAMDDDDIEADQFQHDDVPGEAILQVFVGHRVTAVLHHDGLAVEALDVGQGFSQDGGFGAGARVSRLMAFSGKSPRIVQRNGLEAGPAINAGRLRKLERLQQWPLAGGRSMSRILARPPA